MSEKKLGQEPVYPSKSKGRYADIVIENPGISQRLYLAGMAMQGLLANQSIRDNDDDVQLYWIAQASFNLADELLKQENEQK